MKMICPFKKCGETWESRINHPIRCPRCMRVLSQAKKSGRSAAKIPKEVNRVNHEEVSHESPAP